jgi:hypothetical protein
MVRQERRFPYLIDGLLDGWRRLGRLIAISDHLKIGTSDYFLSAAPLPYYA